MNRARQQRKRIYRRATAIARDVRTADFPDAVNIIARLIAGPMTRKSSRPQTLSDALEIPPNYKIEFETTRLLEQLQVQPSTDVVMVEGTIPVSAPLARELVADGVLGQLFPFSAEATDELRRASDMSTSVASAMSQVRSARCDDDCPQKRASWPGCCKLVDVRDIVEPMGPDSFGGEDGMHAPSVATIRKQIEQRVGPRRWKCKRCGEARRRYECLVCGNQIPITDEPRMSGLVR